MWLLLLYYSPQPLWARLENFNISKWMNRQVYVYLSHSFDSQLTNTGCLVCVGDRLLVDTNATRFNKTAVLVSPVFDRSRDGHSKCLKFRYMLRGPGLKTLTIYQKEDSRRETPVWVSERKTGPNWIYGQVPLSSISKFQVTIWLRPIMHAPMNSFTGTKNTRVSNSLGFCGC